MNEAGVGDRPVETEPVTMPRDSDPRTVQVIDRKRTGAGKRMAGAE